MAKMCPHAETRAKFNYPRGGPSCDFETLSRMASCTAGPCLTQNEECLIVVKNGTSPRVTLGRATSIESSIRNYSEYHIRSTSMEIAIYTYCHKDGAFSALGLSSVTPTVASSACSPAVPVKPTLLTLPMRRHTTSLASVSRRPSHLLLTRGE